MTWESDLLELVQGNWRKGGTFTLREVYNLSKHLQKRHPRNTAPDARIRRTLQILRDKRIVEFVDNRGTYRRLR